MKNINKPIWSDEALNDLKRTIDFLENRWTEKQIRIFVQLLNKQLRLIEDNPNYFSLTAKSDGLRRVAISSQTTIYYRITHDEARIISFFDNRHNQHKSDGK